MTKVLKENHTALPSSKPRPKKASVLLTGHIELARYGESAAGELFVEVRFKHRNLRRTRLLPLNSLTPNSAAFDALNFDGARLISPQARQELIRRVQDHQEVGPRVPVATRLGWHDGAYVLPHRKFGPGKDDIKVHLDHAWSERFSRYRAGGSFKAWLEIARLAEGNTRLMLLISTAFSGPVAALLGLEQIGIMLVGPSQVGKTSMLFAAGSVWGCHPDPVKATQLGFPVPLNATDNDLEDELLAANHTLLAIDETRSAGLDDAQLGKLLLQMIMRWEIGFEKGRKNPSKPRQAASAPFILTSNASLAELAAKAGTTVDDAYHSRLICVPTPDHPALHPVPARVHGAFEDLHGEANVVALSRRLRTLAISNFGYSSRRFLRFLAADYHKDPEGLRAWFEKMRSAYLKVARKITSHGRTLDRLHEKMATVYAAACFAIEHKILPWGRDAVRHSLLACTRAHVELVAHEAHHVVVPARPSRPMGASLDPELLIQRLHQHFAQNKASVIDGRDPKMAHQKGDARCPIIRYQHKKHGREYLFTEGRLSSIFPSKAELDAVKAALHARGHIATETGADGIPRFSVKRSLPGKQRIQVIAVPAAAFQDDL